MAKLKILALAAGVAAIWGSTTCSLAADALEPVVVTATRTATPLSEVASSVTVVTAEEIEARQQMYVPEVLRRVPGVTVVQSGPIGGQTSIFLRGADNKHTLVLIDGIEFRDASAIGGGANLANLSTDNIERIEIVRGAQSVLYGSDAIGGVINIITKTGAEKLGAHVSAEGGSYNTKVLRGGFSHGNDIYSVSLAASKTQSDGFSAANEDNGNKEEDGYDNKSLLLNLVVKPVQRFELALHTRYTDADIEFDDSFGDIVSDADNSDENTEKTGQITGTFYLIEDRWNVQLRAAVTDFDRDTKLNSEFGPYNYGYNGKIKKYDVLNNIKLENHKLILGLETEKEEYEGYADGTPATHADARTNAIFIQDQFNSRNFSASVGLRHDNHEDFGDKTTWRVTSSYRFEATDTRLKGSAGTGFKAPSLYQLKDPYSGNLNLDAEESLGYDFGIEQSLFNHLAVLGLTWFQNDIEDHIDFDNATGKYFQGGDIKTEGIESTVGIYPADFFDIGISYTYTDTRQDGGERKARIPLHAGSLDINFYPDEKLICNISMTYTGERDDGATDTELDDYILVNLASSYQLTDNVKFFGRVHNLFDEDYEEAAGFGTAGLSGYVGAKLTF